MRTHPLGDTLTLRNTTAPRLKEVVEDAATGNRVITVITPTGDQMPSKDALESLCALLESFIAGDDRSLTASGKIEVALDEAFPHDEEVQDYVTMFACYRPEGGDYLYDQERMIAKSRALMVVLRDRLAHG